MTLGQEEDYTAYRADDQRYPCNLKRSPVSVAYYEPAEGYAGEDTAIVDVIFPSGGKRSTTFKIVVQ